MAQREQDTGSAFYSNNDTLTLTKVNANNAFFAALVARSSATDRTISTFDYGSEPFDIIEEEGPSSLITQEINHGVGVINDAEISESIETLTIGWSGAMTEDGNGLGLLLSGALQSGHIRAQTGTGLRFQTFENAVPTDLTINDAKIGDVIVYILMNNDATPGAVANFVQVGTGTTGDSLLDEGGSYYRQVTSDLVDVTIPAPVGTSVSGYHFAFVIKGDAVADVTGTLAVTLDDATIAAVGQVGEDVTGTLTVTLDDSMIAAVGQVGEDVTGTLAVTLDDSTIVASGQVGEDVTGTLTLTLDDATIAASGTVGDVVTGTLALTLDDSTIAAVGQVGEDVTGTLIVTLDDATIAAVGQVGAGITGALAVNLDNATIAASGLISQDVTGTLAVNLDNATIVASGQVGGVLVGDDNDVNLTVNITLEDINLTVNITLKDINFTGDL